jgi:solute carrier family 25 phosphate transporter 3
MDIFPSRVFSAASTAVAVQRGAEHYLKGAFAGGICCAITVGAVCPVDVVKTRMQLYPKVHIELPPVTIYPVCTA